MDHIPSAVASSGQRLLRCKVDPALAAPPPLHSGRSRPVGSPEPTPAHQLVQLGTVGVLVNIPSAFPGALGPSAPLLLLVSPTQLFISLSDSSTLSSISDSGISLCVSALSVSLSHCLCLSLFLSPVDPRLSLFPSLICVSLSLLPSPFRIPHLCPGAAVQC